MEYPSVDLGAQSVGDLGDVVADRVGQNAGEEVQVGGAVGVEDVSTLTPHDLDRLVVVQRLPGGHDRPVPRQQIGFGHGDHSGLPIAHRRGTPLPR